MNTFMNWVTENWFLISALVAVLGCAGAAVYKFAGLLTDKQIEKLKEWLLWAVTVAEKELGGGTGALKLRYVYDWFVRTFPWLAKMISFEYFSQMVDEALEQMKKCLIVIRLLKSLWKRSNYKTNHGAGNANLFSGYRVAVACANYSNIFDYKFFAG